jgi:hypothetical protein
MEYALWVRKASPGSCAIVAVQKICDTSIQASQVDKGSTSICETDSVRIDTLIDVNQDCNIFFNMAIFLVHDNTLQM